MPGVVYWLGDSSIAMLQSTDGRVSKKRKREDDVSMAWDELVAVLPSENRGGRGQQLAERVGATPSLKQSVGSLIKKWREPGQWPRAVVMSSGYNRLQEDDPGTIAGILMEQVLQLHVAFPKTQIILLGLAVSNEHTRLVGLANAVTRGLIAFAEGKDVWLSLIQPEAWLAPVRQHGHRVWEEGSLLHLSVRARCEQLRVIRAQLLRV